MKKKLFRFLLFGIIPILIFLSFEIPISIWYGKYWGIPGQYHLFEKRRAEVKTLFIGDSHIGYGIDTAAFSSTTYALWSPAQDLYYTSQLLLKNIPRMSKLNHVIVNLSYFSFANITAIHNPQYINDYYHIDILPSNRFDPRYISTLYAKNNYLYYKTRSILKIKYNIPFSPKFESRFDTIPLLFSESDFIEHAKHKCIEHGIPVNDAKTHPNYIARNIHALNDIVAVCEANKIALSFIITPHSKYYLETFDGIKTFYPLLQAYKHRMPHLTVMDFSSIYVNKLEYFRDSDHLNEAGAKTFCMMLDSVLIKKQ